ncbi:MAG: lipopolysaccharide biosynthesis protein [Planctomycetota bacterium]
MNVRGSESTIHLDTANVKQNLRVRSLQGGVFIFAAQACKFVLMMGFTYVLARLLSTTDFGLMGMVMAVTSFVVRFRDMGLSLATVQRDVLDHQQVSTLFWINVATGLALTILTMAAAPVLAWFYGEARLTGITLTLSAAMFLGGVSAQHHALLRRQMRFKTLAMIQVCSVLVGSSVAAALALMGAQYWALVWMHLSAAATLATGCWLACDWRPSKPLRHSGVRSMVVFGRDLTVASLLGQASRSVDNMLIGWQLGPSQVGLYAKAYQLLLLPIRQINSPISGVAIPTLSRLQHDPDQYRGYYRRGTQMVVSLGIPLVAFLAADSERAILTMLGDQWRESILVFQCLGPAAVVSACNIATGWVYVSLAQTSRQLRWSIVEATVTTLAFVIGIQWGIIGMAIACSASFCILWIPGIIYCFRTTPLRFSDFVLAVWRPFCAAIVAAVVFRWLARVLIPVGPSIAWLLLDAVFYGGIYMGAWVSTPRGWSTLREVTSLLQETRTARDSPQSNAGI